MRLRPKKPFDDMLIDHPASQSSCAHRSKAMSQVLPQRRSSEVQTADTLRFKPHNA
jgi:hypothetical protein